MGLTEEAAFCGMWQVAEDWVLPWPRMDTAGSGRFATWYKSNLGGSRASSMGYEVIASQQS